MPIVAPVYLLINTVAAPQGFVALATANQIVVQFLAEQSVQSELLSVGLTRLLVKVARRQFGPIHRGSDALSQLTGIIVVTGPGRFSAVRAGVVMANALAWGLTVPLAGVLAQTDLSPAMLLAQGQKKLRRKLLLPVYSSEPSITWAKK